MTSRILLASFVALSLTCAAHADTVDDYVSLRMRREHIPGLSLVVLRGGKVVKARGYGKASLELNAPATPATVYDLASTTKPFVAAAVLLLAQDGKLRLDDPVGRHLTDAPESWKGITLRHLLSHTAGIPDYLRDLRQDFPHDTPPDAIYRAVRDLPLRFAPGSKWEYSNTGYVVLGMVVSRAGGKTYDTLLRERVFAPAGMGVTRRHTPDEVVPGRASGYLWYGGRFHNGDFLKFLMTDHGDRGLVSTALDLAKWDAFLRADSSLSAASKRAMWTPTPLAGGGVAEYGLGWFVKDINGHRQVSHPGGAPGTAAIFTRYPDDDLTVIVLANGRAFVQALERGVARHYLPGLAAEKAVGLKRERLDSVAGYYNAYGSQLLTATRDGAGLLLDDGGGLNNTFVPVSESRFVAEEAERAFTMIPDGSGAILKLGVDEMAVQRIGPLAHTLAAQPDPDPALTGRIGAALRAMAAGERSIELAPQAREDYARGPAPELAGIERIDFVAERDLSAQGISRHGAKVARVRYYRLRLHERTRYVLIYLTAEGLVTDQDVVDA